MPSDSIARPTPGGAAGALVALGCAVLFCLPFIGTGLFLVTLAVTTWNSRSGDSTGALFLAVAGTVFALAGGGVVLAAVVAFRKERLAHVRRAAAPDQPWLWRDDWSSGHSRADSGAGAAFLVAFAFFWNIIAFPVGILVLTKWRSGEAAVPALLGLLFPLIGIFLIWGATVKLLQHLRFGKTRLLLNDVPLRLGSAVRCELEAPSSLQDAERVSLTLSNVKEEVTGSGKSRSRRDVVLWQELHEVARPAFSPGPAGQILPLTFALPVEGRETETVHRDLRYLWRLEVKAELGGPDFVCRFELPVFGRSASAAESGAMFGAVALAATQPTSVSTSVDFQLGTALHFAPGQSRKGAVGALAFGLAFAAIGAAAVLGGAPILFGLIFSAVGALVAYSGWDALFGTSEVTASGQTLIVKHDNRLRTAERRFTTSDIRNLTAKIVSTSGGLAVYGVIINATDGKTHRLCGGLRDQGEARWVIEELQRLLGPTLRRASSEPSSPLESP